MPVAVSPESPGPAGRIKPRICAAELPTIDLELRIAKAIGHVMTNLELEKRFNG